MTHGREKSDSAIVAGKPTNKAVPTAAEPVEPRAGAKGDREPAKHAPDTGTGARVTSAGTRTASRAKEEGEVHCAPPPHQHRQPANGVLRRQTRRRLWGRWIDLADLRSRP